MNYLLDFNDSYTYNLYADFVNLTNLKLRVINIKDHETFINSFFKDKDFNFHTLIFGPGPFSPLKYKIQMNFLDQCIKKNICIIGICLGHQMITSILGAKIIPSKEPKHGIREKLLLNKFWKNELMTNQSSIDVQRYNSLAVIDVNNVFSSRNFCTIKSKLNEIMLLKSTSILSMQFHPESIGTENKIIFFNMIKKFITEYSSLKSN